MAGNGDQLAQRAHAKRRSSLMSGQRLKFPVYGACEAKADLDDLFRLVSPDLFDTEYIDARSAAKLVAAGLEAYRSSIDDPRWNSDPVLAELHSRGRRINLVCAALFDLVCNSEYLHGRITNRSWIYCHREPDKSTTDIYAYYSFLKQCPRCCQDRGLDPRISGAQHKPTSHHIGEITAVATALILALLAKSAAKPLEVGVISKQSHNVDALAWREDLLVLFEIKASPLVTYPVRVKLAQPFTEPGVEGPEEIKQHRLVDIEFNAHELSLYLANADVDIPLGRPSTKDWPYRPITDFISRPGGLLAYMSAWGEVFLGYSVPKVERTGREIVMGYLANGWGDEIDSNKTKAGLGRTDDIKKGTYQLLKFGAYYRDGSPNLPIRGALAANLDPLFMYREYLEKLIDARWAPASKFRTSQSSPEYKEILERDLFYIYDAVLAFNRPFVNDPVLAGCFDFAAFESALLGGLLDELLSAWKAA
jgi:hypothetical protein